MVNIELDYRSFNKLLDKLAEKGNEFYNKHVKWNRKIGFVISLGNKITITKEKE